jgi:putative two-component system response regulator
MKNHSRRVAALTAVLCQCLELDQRTSDDLILSAHLHDIGKVSLPRAIVEKPGRLTPDEVQLIRRHTELGAKALQGLGYVVPALVALRHHERWDGSGYPNALKGEAIPFAARVITSC